LIVSHEMIGRMLLRNLLDVDPHTALAWSQPHDVIFEIRVASQSADRLCGTLAMPFWPAAAKSSMGKIRLTR
jgi:broad specificity phosphatase PhoE